MKSKRDRRTESDRDGETEEESEERMRERRSEGCSLASKRCSKLSAQYGPEGTPPLLTQTYHTHTHTHTRTVQRGGNITSITTI